MATTTTAPITTEQIREAINWEARCATESECRDHREFKHQVDAVMDGETGRLSECMAACMAAWQKSVAYRDSWLAVDSRAADVYADLRHVADLAILIAARLVDDREAGRRAGKIAFAAKAIEMLQWVGRDGGER